MRIDALDVYYVAHPLIEPWTTAYGSDPVIYSVMVKLTSGGETSWSESCPFLAPTYSPECAYGAYYVASEFLAPLVLGQSCDGVREGQSVCACGNRNCLVDHAIQTDENAASHAFGRQR